MKRSIWIVVVIAIVATIAVLGFGRISQPDSLESYPSHLPRDLELKEEGPQKYLFTCDYFTFDPYGNLIIKERVSSEYTRGLPDGIVSWNNVRIAQAENMDEPFPEGEIQDYMEGFSYLLSDFEDLLKPDFFEGFPESAINARNLLWDAHMFEMLGQDYFDELEHNRVYYVEFTPEEANFSLAGLGTFQNGEVELIWIGISQRNNETCALIQYRAFFNKVEMSFEGSSINGTSNYWGDIWVSLEDKQIEYATLYEDVLVEMKANGQEMGLFNTFRRGTFEKIVATDRN